MIFGNSIHLQVPLLLGILEFPVEEKQLEIEDRYRHVIDIYRQCQDITASNKSQHYQPESMPRNSRSGGKGTCVLLGVGEN